MSSNQVLLGIRDSEIEEETNWMTNKIGGKADWMPVCTNPPNLKCILCNNEMVLVVQLYCPLGNSSYHRTLYVFCCINRSCWNKQQSWQVYRNQHLFQNESHKFPKASTCTNEEDDNVQKQSWLSDELDWEDAMSNSNEASIDILHITEEIANLDATDENSNSNLSDQNESFKLFMNTKSVDSLKELPWNISNFIPTGNNLSFKSYYINVIDEPDTTDLDIDPHVQRLLNAYIHEGNEIDSIQDGGNSNSERERYEKDCVKHGDNLFHKFAKRVARCQNQIIRYCWGSQPLLISKLDHKLPTSCQKCKGPLIFEFQLMPALIKMLKLPNYENMPVEFGTVIVMTCQQSCWEDEASFCQEFTYLQSDPDESFFQQQ